MDFLRKRERGRGGFIEKIWYVVFVRSSNRERGVGR